MEQQFQKNELSAVFLQNCGLNPFHQHTSSSRAYMQANHVGQMLVINGSTERQIQTGVEREFGKYTFRVEMPVDAQIIQVIDRYKQNIGKDSIKENPETVVIYEDVNTKEVGVLRLTTFCSNHQYFGFKYSIKNAINMLVPGAFIPKGTVFLDSPSITDEGNYKYGVQANTIYMTHPATSEDGIAIRKGFLKSLGFKTFETRTVEWGFNKYALNLYGDINNYKPFPDIGEYIRPDGLLMALRSNIPNELAVAEKSVRSTMYVDHTFDSTFYANGGGGKIIDIRINHDYSDNNYAEVHMDEQPQKYDSARRKFCHEIVSVWNQLHKQRGEALQLTPEFNRLVVECYSVVAEDNNYRMNERKQRVIKVYKKAPIDNFRVEFIIEYDVEVGVGFKLTDLHGGK